MLTLICERWPELTFTAGVCFLLWNYSKFYFWTHNKCEDIPDMKKDLSEIKISLAVLSNKIDSLTNSTISVLSNQSNFSNANSPIVLNNDGKLLLEKSGANTYLKNNSVFLVKELSKLRIDSALDVEREAFILLSSKSISDHKFKEIKDFIYNRTKVNSKQVTLSDVLYVMSIRLRDKYLEKHPELKS